MISTVEGDGYKGKIMLIDDPSRVYLAQTKTPDVEGMRILSFLDEYDAVAGINASGFADPGGEGDGSEVIGCHARRASSGANLSTTTAVWC